MTARVTDQSARCPCNAIRRLSLKVAADRSQQHLNSFIAHVASSSSSSVTGSNDRLLHLMQSQSQQQVVVLTTDSTTLTYGTPVHLECR